MNDQKYEIFKLEPNESRYSDQMEELSKTCFSWMSDTEENKQDAEDRYVNNEKFLHIIAVENGRVIGKIGLVKRNITHENDSIILGGIGGVCTIPDKRNQGVASTLLKIAIEELTKTGCDIAYLCTDVDDKNATGLYEKVGFRILGKPHTYFGKSGKLYTDHDAMLAPLNSKVLFDKVIHGKEVFHIGKGNW